MRKTNVKKATRTIRRLRRQDRYSVALKAQAFTSLAKSTELKALDIPGLTA